MTSPMSRQERIQRAETTLGYIFTDKYILVRALTSPGVEERDHDGNRVLARLGKPLIELYAIHKKLLVGASADAMDESSSKALTMTRHEAIAKNSGLDAQIAYCPRQARASPKTLSLAIRALVGAIWLDSAKRFDVVFQVMDRLGLSVEQQICPHPKGLPRTDGSQRGNPNSVSQSEDFQMGLFVDLDLAGASFTCGTSSEAAHEPCNSTMHSSGTEYVTHAVNALDGTMQMLTHCDFQETSAQRRPEFEHWNREGISPYEIEQVSHAHPRNNTQLAMPYTFESAELLGGKQDTSRVDRVSSALHTGNKPLGRKSQWENTDAPKRHKKTVNDGMAVECYISEEKAKYERLALQFPARIYVLPESMFADNIVGKDEHLSIARCLFAGVGSCESLVVLQACLIHGREKVPEDEVDPLRPLPLAQRIQMIESLGAKIAYYELLRRCHILSLYNEHAAAELIQDDPFIVHTDERCFSVSGRKCGNPRNRAAAEITLAMSGDLQYTALNQPGSERVYSKFKRYRKLGERFRLLTHTFGSGMMGLLPPSSPDLTTVTMTDDMLLRLPDPVFKHLIKVIDQNQGDKLRQFAKVVEKVMATMFSSALGKTEPFAIESVDKEKMLSLPKGSTQLLILIS
ncbi:hypothetical protein P153DRAFT_418345 [Dothidotthia symphoricarpi CBS 119687]|uniref:RNase III domain-containing protein n=1 Tax=Dothidotthia symphoricarpi CBS 119687 TaxID=1392245 RepID=A0A6A6AEI5_9PLEO|nr:uncharacterized protein P153DRAFT_418345 [Dothidotthia symphoricarpi CBS 119687]KAF2129713.1 hypothetical protein P153DRAFT_418345 [Dothidotthia symphoricarpi CBS 119687]